MWPLRFPPVSRGVTLHITTTTTCKLYSTNVIKLIVSVMIGMITLPMTFLSGTPLDCAIHPELWYSNLTTDLFSHNDVVSRVGTIECLITKPLKLFSTLSPSMQDICEATPRSIALKCTFLHFSYIFPSVCFWFLLLLSSLNELLSGNSQFIVFCK